MWSGKCKQHRHTKAGEKELYRLVHEGNLRAPQQPLASACISHPIQEANIPAGACYQQNPSNCTKNCLKFSEIYETSDPLLTFMAFMIYSACLPPNILYQKTNKYIHIYIYIYISKHLLFQLCCVSIRIKPFSSELITQYGGTWPKTLQVHTQL